MNFTKQILQLHIQAKQLLPPENRDLKCEKIAMESIIEDLKYQEQQLALIPYQVAGVHVHFKI